MLRNGKVITEEVSILRKKVPLTEIRKGLLASDQEFSKFTKEEVIEKLLETGELNESEELLSLKELSKKLKQLERTRYSACCHDNSSFNNPSHLLVTKKAMYDTACFLTHNKYYLEYKRQINAQTGVEKLHLYILACCPSNNQQIFYSEERASDILKISEPLQSYNGLEIYDVLRSFKEDSLARQFELGHRKEGNVFCIASPIHANNIKNVVSSFRKELLSIQDRVEKVKSTKKFSIPLREKIT